VAWSGCCVTRGMQPPLFVRPVTEAEQRALRAGLRTADAFTVRRCQILLASARGETPPQIARHLACAEGTARTAIHAFSREGVACLARRSTRPLAPATKVRPGAEGRLRALVAQSPRTFGYSTSLWTLPLLAEVSLAEGVTTERVTGETIRQALQRLGVRWQRAKPWLTSPDPAYRRKKGPATD
jgi:hypothetical protein